MLFPDKSELIPVFVTIFSSNLILLLFSPIYLAGFYITGLIFYFHRNVYHQARLKILVHMGTEILSLKGSVLCGSLSAGNCCLNHLIKYQGSINAILKCTEYGSILVNLRHAIPGVKFIHCVAQQAIHCTYPGVQTVRHYPDQN